MAITCQWGLAKIVNTWEDLLFLCNYLICRLLLLIDLSQYHVTQALKNTPS